MKNLASLFIFISFIGAGFSQDSTFIDSVFINNYSIQKDDPIVVAMDSMLEYYRSIDQAKLDSFETAATETEIPSFEDFEIKKKLETLNDNTPFSFNFNKVTKQYIRMYEKRRTSISIFLARKETYFPIFEECLLKYKLPMELKYLPIVESALKPNAESWAGAAGLWQFMYNTGKQYGLEADSYYDKRRDPYLATEAACKHLARLYKVYGNWELVLAAYNAGGGNVNKAIRKSGGKRDYWEIFQYLPRETQGYVPAFIAVNYMMNYHVDYSISSKNPMIKYSEIDTIFVSDRVDLNVVSKFINEPIELLNFINPMFYTSIIPNKEDTSCLYLPKMKIGEFMANKASIYAMSNEIKKTYTLPEYASNYKEKGKRTKYRVRKGDYLGKIASKYNCKVSEIKKWNNLRSNKLKTGQILVVYSSKKTTKKPKEKKTVAKLKIGESYRYYTIKKGDTLWEIAEKYPGVSVKDITNHNADLNSNNLKTGRTIKIIQRG